MLEFLDNYENADTSIYPCIYIDWLTNFEIQYIQSKFSNYSNSLDELSILNSVGYDSDDLYSETSETDDNFFSLDEALSEKSEEVFDNSLDDLFGSEGMFDDSFGEMTESEGLDGFDDLFYTDSGIEEKEDVTLEELLSVVEDDSKPVKEEKEVDLFSCKLPIFVGEDKITEAVLDIDNLKILNYFFKRKWVLKVSCSEEHVIDDNFLIKNILNL